MKNIQSPFIRALFGHMAENILLWVAGALAVLGVGFLIQYLQLHQLITKEVALFLIQLCGFSLVALAFVPHARFAKLKLSDQYIKWLKEALVAAGLAILYISFYAAYAILHVYPWYVSFVFLGATALLAVGLGLKFGERIAVMGSLAGYLVPLIIDNPKPIMGLSFITLANASITLYVRWAKKPVLNQLNFYVFLGFVLYFVFYSLDHNVVYPAYQTLPLLFLNHAILCYGAHASIQEEDRAAESYIIYIALLFAAQVIALITVGFSPLSTGLMLGSAFYFVGVVAVASFTHEDLRRLMLFFAGAGLVVLLGTASLTPLGASLYFVGASVAVMALMHAFTFKWRVAYNDYVFFAVFTQSALFFMLYGQQTFTPHYDQAIWAGLATLHAVYYSWLWKFMPKNETQNALIVYAANVFITFTVWVLFGWGAVPLALLLQAWGLHKHHQRTNLRQFYDGVVFFFVASLGLAIVYYLLPYLFGAHILKRASYTGLLPIESLLGITQFVANYLTGPANDVSASAPILSPLLNTQPTLGGVQVPFLVYNLAYLVVFFKSFQWIKDYAANTNLIKNLYAGALLFWGLVYGWLVAQQVQPLMGNAWAPTLNHLPHLVILGGLYGCWRSIYTRNATPFFKFLCVIYTLPLIASIIEDFVLLTFKHPGFFMSDVVGRLQDTAFLMVHAFIVARGAYRMSHTTRMAAKVLGVLLLFNALVLNWVHVGINGFNVFFPPEQYGYAATSLLSTLLTGGLVGFGLLLLGLLRFYRDPFYKYASLGFVYLGVARLFYFNIYNAEGLLRIALLFGSAGLILAYTIISMRLSKVVAKHIPDTEGDKAEGQGEQDES